MSFHKPAAVLPLYSSAALWNICMGMLQVLLPLYALSLGFSILKISSLIALPVLAEVVMRFVGGALSDRFGERRVLQGCYLLMVLAASVLLVAKSYGPLFLAQAISYVSRGTFWTPIQSLASQIPGSSAGKKLGRLAACNYGGGLVGLALGGVLASLLGYHNSFFFLTVITLLCAILGLALPHIDPKPRGRTIFEITAGIGRFLRYRQVWLMITISSAAALPPTLTQSLYPLYLAHLNFGEQWIGLTLSLRALGPIFVGLVLGSLITPARQKAIYALGMATLGIFLVGSGLTRNFLLLGLCVAFLGTAGSLMDLLYQVQASELSRAGDRSVVMASMGLGWNISPFFAPLIVGWLAEVAGFGVAFLTAGGFFLLMAAGTTLWHRLLAPEGLTTIGESKRGAEGDVEEAAPERAVTEAAPEL